MSVSTHVLDAVAGIGAAGIPVKLEAVSDGVGVVLGVGVTGDDGRVADLSGGTPTGAGRYRLTLDLAASPRGADFFPEIVVVFEITDAERHHHVPVLLSPFAYTTYRGT